MTRKHEKAVLEALRETGGLSQRSLSERLNMHLSTVSVTMRALREQDLVYRDEFRDEKGRLTKKDRRRRKGRDPFVWRLTWEGISS